MFLRSRMTPSSFIKDIMVILVLNLHMSFYLQLLMLKKMQLMLILKVMFNKQKWLFNLLVILRLVMIERFFKPFLLKLLRVAAQRAEFPQAINLLLSLKATKGRKGQQKNLLNITIVPPKGGPKLVVVSRHGRETMSSLLLYLVWLLFIPLSLKLPRLPASAANSGTKRTFLLVFIIFLLIFILPFLLISLFVLFLT